MSSGQWFIMRDAKTFGPYSSSQLKQHARDGLVTPDDRVAQSRNGPWTSARKVKGLEFAAEPPPPPVRETAQVQSGSNLAVIERPVQAQARVVYVPTQQGQQQPVQQHMYVTTQRTSKKLKLQSLLSSILFLGGFAWIIVEGRSQTSKNMMFLAFAVTLVGVLWFIVNRIRIWWHHD
ncbi:MAG: DUF4339 domain-containing protein [Planctomycetes bacterium]|nr:DUF4339 domain-containing protein [Planctomycetota bacterium]